MVETTTDVQTGVDTTKRVIATGQSTTVTYRIEQSANATVSVQITERLPESLPRSVVLFPDSEDPGEWQYLNDRHLTYTVEISQGETVETAFSVMGTVDADGFASEVVVSTIDTDSVRPDSRITQLASDNYETRNNGDWNGSSESTHSPDRLTFDRHRPAVGIVVSDDAADEVATTTLRAVDRGLPVFVANRSDTESDETRVARRLGATPVRAGIDEPDREDLRTALAVAARNRDYPGVLIVDGTVDVDFEMSLAAFERTEKQVVDAISSRVRSKTLAGIPAYNEAETIEGIVESAAAHVDEVLVVDDGSDDDTVNRAEASGATVVTHDCNRGYGRALKTLFREADTRDVDHLIVLDADGQHDPDDISRLVERQRESGAEVVVGSRFSETSETDLPLYRWLGLRVITALVHLSTGTTRSESRITDTQSGFRAYDGTAVSSLAESSDALDDRMGASVDILRHAYQNGFDVDEVPTTIRYDVENPNTQNPVSHGVSVVATILTTFHHDRPIAALGIPGFVATFAGFGAGLWTLSTVLAGGRFPVMVAVLSAFFVVAGVLSSFTAAVIHSLNVRLGLAS